MGGGWNLKHSLSDNTVLTKGKRVWRVRRWEGLPHLDGLVFITVESATMWGSVEPRRRMPLQMERLEVPCLSHHGWNVRPKLQ